MAESINTELYPIGTADEFIQKVVGLFNYSNGFRNFSLSNNPLELSYAGYPNTYTSVQSELIGEPYKMFDKNRNFDYHLDNLGGIVGFTYNNAYLETLNNSVIGNFNTLRRNIVNFDLNGDNIYTTNTIHPAIFPILRSYTEVRSLNELTEPSVLDRIFNYSKNFRELNVLFKTYKEGDNDGYIDSRYIPSDSEKDKGYNIGTNVYVGSGLSIDNPSINDYDENLVKPSKSRDEDKSITYNVYNEASGFVNSNKSAPAGTTLGIVEGKSGSLVNKTNELFKEGKINSMINRFYLSQNETSELESAVDGEWGISRGRNLVRGDKGKETYNGYDDPYCRVWTISNQYSKYSDRIRPFSRKDGGPVTPDDFDKEEYMYPLRPFSKSKNVREFSSMQNNGLPLIAPMNHDGNWDKNDIKKCMFSIENLAWRDILFDEQVKDRKTNAKRGIGNVLSKEQQGPNGGRIMWFPPYNLKFTENVNVNWNNNSFIGRGEEVYTYVNTARRGTLDFTILIDHPSILDIYSNSVERANNENDQKILRFFAGCDILEPEEGKKEEEENGKDDNSGKKTPSNESTPEKFDVIANKILFAFYPNDFSGEDYLKNSEVAINYLISGGNPSTGYEIGSEGINGCIKVVEKVCKNKNDKFNTWHYDVDDRVSDEVLNGENNYKDLQSFGLNNSDLLEILKGTASGLTKTDTQTARNILRLGDMSDKEIDETIVPLIDINKLKNSFIVNTPEGSIDLLQKGNVKIRCVGFASSHGTNNSNVKLALNRAKLLQAYLIKSLKFDREWFEAPGIVDANVPVGNDSINAFTAKLGRHAAVYIEVSNKDKNPLLNRLISGNTTFVKELVNETIVSAKTVDERNIKSETEEYPITKEYDQEYLYFKEINNSDDFVKHYITEKVKYFDPAFHSITPEGFNARLTFLHQCTRQGPTVAASDSNNAATAGNLAFGRPPVCVLRIGDFYNTRIIIDSISINYDNNGGIQWDMNTEGIGLQPMLANISVSFTFIGGSDLTGPISRLQNAVSYNFFANTSVYDRHADYRNGWISDKVGEDVVNEWQAGIIQKTDKNNG